MKTNETSNNTFLRRILKFLGSFLAAIAALIGIPAAIWTIIDHNKKPAISFSIAGYTITEDNPCTIYYLIPQEYYESPMNGSLLFDVFNSGSAELTNVYAMLKCQSLFDTQPAVIYSSGREKTVWQKDLRLRRLIDQDYYDDIAGEKISVSYDDYSECLTFVCRNLPKGMIKSVQPFFAIDKEYIKKKGLEDQNNDEEKNTGGQIYDWFPMDITYAATDIPTKKIQIPIYIVEEVSIDDVVQFYENEGRLFKNAMSVHPQDIQKGYVNSILIYPKYVVENNVINVDIEDAQVYHVVSDTYFKKKKSRTITIRDMNKGMGVSYKIKDTPKRKAYIKKSYDEFYRSIIQQ